MYIEIKIINQTSLNQRAYIEYYFKNKRYREYNANRLKMDINPNRSKTLKQRDVSLKKLQLEFLKAFENGWSPTKAEVLEIKVVKSIKEELNEVLGEKLSGNYSLSYKRDLESVFNKFIAYMPSKILNQPIEDFYQLPFDKFLLQFKSSATYYMNNRRVLGVLFSELLRKRLIPYNPIKDTIKQKGTAKLHEIYSGKELKDVLSFLKGNYPNLHLCCILAYGCFLRPHQEIRLLKLKHLSSDFSQIKLSGSENKSKRVRIVNVPLYVQKELKAAVEGLYNQESNIISKSVKPFNVCYFNLQWSRAKKKMEKDKIIQERQTIYSFRHTAAVQVYKRTKDLNILQQLLGHSNMIVTLKYLRGLGEATNEELKDVMPEL